MMTGKELAVTVAEINYKYPKSKQLQFIERTEWIFPCTVKSHMFWRFLHVNIDAHKLGMAGYKTGNISKVIEVHMLQFGSQKYMLF